ncbi:MAG TPA: BadF/BadG/BcrA/BcrD ATPase family protein [Acidobacteriaceae bacterium]
MSFYLAVDAGGTKADFVLADTTRELARARSGTIKRMRTDEATVRNNLESALSELTARTGIAMDAITRTCIGTAGETVPLVTDWLRDAFSSRVGGDLLLLGDAEIALDAASPGAAGVLVLAGTGSNVAGRSSTGQIISAGGYGPVLAEQGSGYRIGYEALRALFLARDEGRTTSLQPAILQFWQLNSIDQLVAHANSLPAPDFSQLAGLVLQCANQGDEIAAAVLRRQGMELGFLVRLIIRRLKTLNPPEWIPSIAFAGSIMERVAPVRNALIEAVQYEFPEAQALSGVVDPVCGALWRARNSSTN